MTDAQPVPITPRSGVVKTESKRIAEGRYIDADKIRFVRGTDGNSRPQKRGGRTRETDVVAVGIIRTTRAYIALSGNRFYAAGTAQKLYVYDASMNQYDVTPITETGSLASAFTTTLGSATVRVNDVAHGRNPGDTVIFTSTTGGGVTILGSYIVQAVLTADAYTILASNVASSAATFGSPTYSYELPIGSELATYGDGVGIGPWGLGTWGTPRDAALVIEPRVWSLDPFGQVLIAAYNTGKIYTLDPTGAPPFTVRAVLMTNSPTDCRFAFVTAERFVVALCSNMVLRWCTQGDYTVWTPALGNTANTRTLTDGSKLIAGKVLGPFVSLIWSDSSCYQMQWTGDAYVYRTSIIGTNCGLLSPNAVVVVAGVAFWQGADNFWMCSGSGVQQMPNVNDIRRFVFDNMTSEHVFQCHAIYNPNYNEVEFVYTMDGETAPSHYVLYNIDDQSWTPGTTSATSGSNWKNGDTRPYVADADGHLYLTENGTDNNGAAMLATITLAPYAMTEGINRLDVESFLLDLFDQSGDVTLTLNTWDRVTDSAVEDSETDIVPETGGLTDTRVSGRYIGFTVTSDEIGGHFQFGKPVAFVKDSGVRS